MVHLHTEKKEGGLKPYILLVPPEINSFYQIQYQNYHPLGVLALAASLEKNGFRADVYQPHIKLFNKEKFRETALEILSGEPDMIGFSSSCTSYPASLLIARNIKAVRPEIPVVFGGPQATLLSKETLGTFDCIDFILGGECDFTFPELVKTILFDHDESKLSGIAGLTYKSASGEIIQNKPGGSTNLS